MKNKERTSMLFALAAGILSLAAFITYSWKMLVGESHPNISSWLVWSFLTLLNAGSYRKLTKDWVKSILPTANACMTLVALYCAFRSGSFKSLSTVDITCLVIGVLAGLAWWIKKSASFAQILLQASIVVGFIPTFGGVYDSPATEPWLSWLLWTLSFTAQCFAVKCTWKGKYIEFLYPTLMLVCHAIVFGMALQ